MLKILVIGNSCTGKTQIINRYVQNKFNPDYKRTVACDFSMKIIRLDEQETRLQLWDLVGDSSQGVNKLFCRNANGAIIVADITNKESIEACIKLKNDVSSHVSLNTGEPIPMILLANKYDLIEEQEEQKNTAG